MRDKPFDCSYSGMENEYPEYADSSKKLKELEEKYPDLYRDVYCGFFCPRGWYSLVDEISEKLEAINSTIVKHDERIRCVQVKEKFGSLVFYIDAASRANYKEALDIISDCELRSSSTCEVTGNEGVKCVVGTSYIRTLCPEEIKKQNAKLYE